MGLRRCVTCTFTDVRGRVVVGRRRHPKRWELPGGFVEVGETWHNAALREAAEEVGAKAHSLQPMLVSVDADNGLLCVTYRGRLTNPSHLARETKEMSEVRLVTTDEAERLVAPIYLQRVKIAVATTLWIQIHSGAKTLSLQPCTDRTAHSLFES